MGFLIFAYRKLCLKQTINRKSFRLMQLGVEQQRIQNQMSIMQQAKSTVQDTWALASNSINSVSGNIYQASINAANADASAASNKYEKIHNDFINGKVTKSSDDSARADMERAQADSEKKVKALFAAQQATQSASMIANHVVNSVFAETEKAQSNMLHLQDQRIDSEKTALESQLKVLNYELDSVSKAEDNAAKQVAPTFGLS